MSTPSLRAIFQRNDDQFTLLWVPGLKDAFFVTESRASIKEFAFFNRAGKKLIDYRGLLELDSPIDDLISLQPWFTHDLGELIKLLRPKRTIGFNKSYDVFLNDASGHYVDRMFRLASIVNPNANIEYCSATAQPQMTWLKQSDKFVRTLPQGVKLLTWHSDTKPYKMWEPKRFAATLVEFLRTHEEYWAVGIGVNNSDVRRFLVHPRSIVLDSAPLSFNLGLLARSSLFFGVDSCMLHACDMMRIPGVALFGPVPDDFGGCDNFGFRFGPHIHLGGTGSLDDVTVDQSIGALHALSERVRANKEI